MLVRNSRNVNNQLVKPGMSAVAKRPATGNPQELKGPETARMPASVWMQAIAVTQATTVTPATTKN
jgi:hypothetical protein